MIVTLLDGRKCDVLEQECKYRICLQTGYASHYSAAGFSGCSHWTDNKLSCRQWNERGCPPKEMRVMKSERDFHAFDCKRPRYAFTPRTPRGIIKCMNCGQKVPKAAIIENQESKK